MTNIIKDSIRTIPNYPKAGIMFRDINTLLADPLAFKAAVDQIVERYRSQNIDVVAGIEARGFIFGSVVAYQLGAKFVPVRKKGKLPGKVVSQSYLLEYGEDTIEVQEDALNSGDTVLLVDDLIATGGTAMAAIQLIRKLKAEVVESCFVVDLPDLGGVEKLKSELGCESFSLCAFEGE